MTDLEFTKPPIKAVIFDFGGVLMRTAQPAAGRREWEQRLKLPDGELERIVHKSENWKQAQLGIISYDEYWKAVIKELRLTDSELSKLRVDYFRDDFLDPEMMSLIRDLRKRDYKVALLSNDSVMLEFKLREELKIYDDFDAVLISARLGLMKPENGIYQAMLSLLNIRPINAVFIDDNLHNVAAAHYLGMAGIWYQRGMNLRRELDSILDGN
ncbi:MAG: HAD family phosphatase [Anaerolineae bacterium]|nr:HAD family phosphatase [Anaerolineae bacterium]